MFYRYRRDVQYYETDAMKVVHHSNYIRWFEEARSAALRAWGIPYEKLEELGYIGPILSVNCEYHQSARYGRKVEVRAAFVENKPVRSGWVYAVVDAETNDLYALGSSTHCFITEEGKVVSLKKEAPEIYEMFNKYLTDETQQDLRKAPLED